MEAELIPAKQTRIFVKILHSRNHYKSLAEVVYFRNEMTVQFYQRWRWYFEYRAALLRVNNPKGYTEIQQGTYEYVLQEDEIAKKLEDKIRGKKAKITQVKNKVKAIMAGWNELWPIEENENYKQALIRISEMEAELDELTNQKNEFEKK